MDLIYANSRRIDIGIIKAYTLDLAFGSGENDFECKMELGTPECQPGYYLYIDNTEYGGVIDGISVNTEENSMSYIGRTWHGILESKVIEPPDGQEYYYARGEANAVIAQLLELANVGIPFVASTEDSGIKISGYPLRYRNMYDALTSMLAQANAKLTLKWQSGNVVLSAKLLTDYSLLEEFDSSQVQFSVKKLYRHVNHLICLGSGELLDRKVIHLFTDDNGGLQQYLVNPDAQPLQNSDYILDKSKQLIFGRDEYTEIYDYSNAATTENYKPLDIKPATWDTNYFSFYKKDGNRYSKLSQNLKDVYVLLTSQPADWQDYERYYKRTQDSSGEYQYESVTGDETVAYTALTRKPTSWNEKFAEYYKLYNGEYVQMETVPQYTLLANKPDDWEDNYSEYYVTDGVDYSNVTGDSEETYVLQTVRPSDWGSNWKQYYTLANGIYEVAELVYPTYVYAPEWKRGSYYTKSYETVPPEFGSEELMAVYQKEMVPPPFTSGQVYRMDVTRTKAWAANTYYEKKESQDLGIEFEPGVYYEQVFDDYAELVAGGINRLNELNNTDMLDIDLSETEQEYDIGDIVGARENVTGIFASQKVTKKIIKIERDVVTKRYGWS